MTVNSLLLPLTLGLLSLSATAQSAPPAWSYAQPLTTSAGANGQPYLANDAAGNTYVASSFRTPITVAPGTVLSGRNGSGCYLAKYSPTGQLLWATELTGSGNNAVQGLTTDAAGNVWLLALVVGTCQVGSVALQPSSGSYGWTLALARLDAQGQPLGLGEVGHGPILNATGLARDPAGDLYFCGSFQSDATIGTSSFVTPGFSATGYATDQYVAKISATGDPRWVRTGARASTYRGRMSPPAPSFSPTLTVGSGGVYLGWTGDYTAGPFETLALPAGLGGYDGVVIKLDIHGTPQWAQRLGGSGDEILTAIYPDATGRLLVTGATGPLGTISSTSSLPFPTGTLTALDPATGSPGWATQLTTTGTGLFNSLTTDASGNLYVAGTLAGQGSLMGNTLTSAGGTDVLVASFTAAGALRWVQQSSGTGNEYPGAIVSDNVGHLTLTGIFGGQAAFGATTFTFSTPLPSPYITTMAFVAQLNGAGPLSTRAGAAPAGLALYPNPATANSLLALPTLPAGTQLTLLDATGRLLRRQPAAPTLPLTGLAPGLYLVQAQAPDGAQWQSRLLIE